MNVPERQPSGFDIRSRQKKVEARQIVEFAVTLSTDTPQSSDDHFFK